MLRSCSWRLLMEARHFTELAVCAVRYALGRMTYVSFSVPEAIRANLDLVDAKGLCLRKTGTKNGTKIWSFAWKPRFMGFSGGRGRFPSAR